MDLVTPDTLDVDKMIDEAVSPPACEWQDAPDGDACGAAATWIMSLSCGHTVFYDDEHVKAMWVFVGSEGANVCVGTGAPVHRPRRVDVRFDRIAS